MIFNALGFLLLPYLIKLKVPVLWVGNIYVFVGAVAVTVLTYFSGGMWSAIFPWIISIPVLALLVVNKISGMIWGGMSFLLMVAFGLLAIQGIELPVEYNHELKTQWFISILPGLLLIILFISFIFENTQSMALKDLELKNKILESQKQTISDQSRELEKYIEEKDNIIGILAHDLKNPLFNIASLTNFLKDDPESKEREKFIELMQRSSANALDLIEKVLKMNAAEQKNLPLRLEKIQIESFLNEILTMAEDIAFKKEITIKLDNTSTLDIVESDKTYLKLIFENLLSNAIKFSQKGMQVRVVISQLNNELQVAVIDEGPGIKSEEEKLLFKKFTKLSARPTGGESSTGLGLSLVKHYVEILQGNVHYKRNEGNGATFIVQIPHQFQVA